MPKDIEEPVSPVRNKNPRLGKKKIYNGVSEGPEQIASDLAKVVRGVFLLMNGSGKGKP